MAQTKKTSGTGSIVSETKGSMFGNILFGGGIGAIVDHNTGAAYENPAFFKIVMGAAHGGIAADQEAATPLPSPARAKEISAGFEQLEALKRMLDKGIITQAEFEMKKTAVLKQM